MVGILIAELGIPLAYLTCLQACDAGMPQSAQRCSEQATATAWDVAVSAWYLAHPRQSLLSRADNMWAIGSCGWESQGDIGQDHGQGGGADIRGAVQ